MRRWPWAVTLRVRTLVRERRVLLTSKARREIAASDLGIDERDALEILAGLTPERGIERIRSSATGEWLCVYRPYVAGVRLYVKLALRWSCVVVSFHEEKRDRVDEQAQP